MQFSIYQKSSIFFLYSLQRIDLRYIMQILIKQIRGIRSRLIPIFRIFFNTTLTIQRQMMPIETITLFFFEVKKTRPFRSLRPFTPRDYLFKVKSLIFPSKSPFAAAAAVYLYFSCYNHTLCFILVPSILSIP